MKTKMTFLLFFLLPMFLFCQDKDEYLKYTRNHFKHIEWNGKKYSNSPRGAWLLLKEIESVDPQLFKIIEVDFKKFNKEMTTGMAVSIAGAAGFSGFLIAAFLEELKDTYGSSMNARRKNIYYISSFTLLSVGVGIGIKLVPNKRIFVYNFTEKINANSQKVKAKFTICPDIQLGNNSSVGLSFSLQF